MRVGDKVVFRGEVTNSNGVFGMGDVQVSNSYIFYKGDLQLDQENTEKVAEELELIEATGYAIIGRKEKLVKMIHNNKEILSILALDRSALAEESRRILIEGVESTVEKSRIKIGGTQLRMPPKSFLLTQQQQNRPQCSHEPC